MDDELPPIIEPDDDIEAMLEWLDEPELVPRPTEDLDKSQSD